jgi:hypothetical protein
MLAGCVSPALPYYTEDSIRAGMLPSQGVATVGFGLRFEGIPEDLEWRIELRMKDVNTQKSRNLFAEGKDFVLGKLADKAPVVFSLPVGNYVPEAIVFHFSSQENLVYNIEEERLMALPAVPVKAAEVRTGWMLYIGEVSLAHSEFVAGKFSHRTKFSARWNPAAPALGITWSQVRERMSIADLGFYPAIGTKSGGPVSARLLFDKTTDATLSALGSGFSDSYGAVLVKSSFPGFAFFDDKAGNTHRVQSMPFAGTHYFALAVSEIDTVSLRGFCVAEKGNSDSCPKETVQEPPLWNQEKFEAGEIRFRGAFSQEGNRFLETPFLDEGTALSMDKKVPGLELRSFVLSDMPRKRDALGLVMLDATGVREKWEPVSLPFVEKIRAKALECAEILKKTDPFASVAFELSWDFSEEKWLMRENSLKGIDVNASNVFRRCFESEFDHWKGLGKTELAKGFGVRFR